MKKRKFSIIAAVLALLFAMIALVGCGGVRPSNLSNVRVDNPQTDTNYLVIGNGSMAVQYGQYVYFVNGARGFEDPDGTANRWGQVVQGGIYRTRLFGNSTAGTNGGVNTWNTVPQNTHEAPHNLGDLEEWRPEQRFDFHFSLEYRYDHPTLREEFEDEEILQEKTYSFESVRIAPRTVGVEGIARGIWIFNDMIYFATPNNLRNRQGEIQDYRTDFIRMGLNGRNAQRIFTTRGSSFDEEFGFFPQPDGAVYLVTSYRNEEGSLNVISIRTRGSRVYNPVYLAQNATSVTIPVTPVFDRTITNPRWTLNDFVFFTRPATREDPSREFGNVIEVRSPCGLEGFSYQADGRETVIEDVRDGTLFYRVTTATDVEVRFTDLHNILMLPASTNGGVSGSARYRAYWSGNSSRRQMSGIAVRFNNPDEIDEWTVRYFFRGSAENAAGYMLGFNAAGVFMLSYVDRRYSDGDFQVLNISPTFLFVQDEYLYFRHEQLIFRVNMFTRIQDRASFYADGELLTDREALVSNVTASIVGDILFFFAPYDMWTPEDTGYTFFVRMLPGQRSFFIGTRDEDHIPTYEFLREQFEREDQDEDDEFGEEEW